MKSGILLAPFPKDPLPLGTISTSWARNRGCPSTILKSSAFMFFGHIFVIHFLIFFQLKKSCLES
jgi:hypothetical protein